MYFYLAMVGFEPTPTSTAAPSNTETTVIPSYTIYIVKLGFTGVYTFFYFAPKHRLWVLLRTCTHNPCFEQKYEKSYNFSSENYHFYSRKILLYIL